MVLLILPSEYYVKATCGSLNPSSRTFGFGPFLVFFLAVTLPFTLAVAVSCWKKLDEKVVIFASSCATLLVGVALIYLLKTSPLALSVSVSPALLLGKRGKRQGRITSLVSFMSILSVYLAIKMAMAMSI